MSCEKIVSAAREVATGCGLSFFYGEPYRIASGLKSVPAFWILPPALVKSVGITEGLKYYKVTFYIVDWLRNYPAGSGEIISGGMEALAGKITEQLCGKNGIRAVDGLTCSPEENTLTNMGDVSVKVDIDILLNF